MFYAIQNFLILAIEKKKTFAKKVFHRLKGCLLMVGPLRDQFCVFSFTGLIFTYMQFRNISDYENVTCDIIIEERPLFTTLPFSILNRSAVLSLRSCAVIDRLAICPEWLNEHTSVSINGCPPPSFLSALNGLINITCLLLINQVFTLYITQAQCRDL